MGGVNHLNYLYIGAGGFLGTISRYAIEKKIVLMTTDFPASTFTANIAGSLLIGFIMTLALERPAFSPNVRMGMTTGFLGGLTTFSTYTHQTLLLLERGKPILALMYSLASVFFCLLAVWLGITLARAVSRLSGRMGVKSR